MPGVKKPVNSWMYWKPWSKLPSSGRAVAIATSTDTVAAMRPTRTSVAWLLCGRAFA